MIQTLDRPATKSEERSFIQQVQLDSEQKQAVTASFNNTLVRANAGSGKTRVLTTRVAHLLSSGISEDQIMLLTFTKKASNEMIERVEKLLGKKQVGILGGTFHSIGARFLRRYSGRLGYDPNFTILDGQDSRKLMGDIRKKFLKERKIKTTDFPATKILNHYLSSSINRDMSLDEINDKEGRFDGEVMFYIQEIFERYATEKKKLNAMDFDDLIVNFLRLLGVPAIQERISQQYPFILVDEYQDVNHIQAKIVEKLNGKNEHLFVVGDPNQAIYGWRGSDISYIEGFSRQYENANDFYITHNYRSDKEILCLAEDSINNNHVNEKERVQIRAAKPSVNKPTLHDFNDEYEQAEFVATQIKKHWRNGTPYEEIAVLIRKNKQAMALERVFHRHDIPYQLLAGLSFFERKHVKDVLAFLRSIENPRDEVAFKRMACLFGGIGEGTAEKLHREFVDSDYSIHALKNAKVSKRAQSGLGVMTDVLREISRPSLTVSKMIEFVVHAFYRDYLRLNEEDYEDRLDDLSRLSEDAEQYVDLTDFLNELILDDSKEEDIQNVVTISTVHKSKGLEWDVVFIPTLNDGEFSTRQENIKEDEEERRVFYVATTRARQFLHMSYVHNEFRTYQAMYPSAFLEELDERLFKKVEN